MRTGRPPTHVGCKVQGCERDHEARGYCAAHYKRVVRTGNVGDAEVSRSKIRVTPCSVRTCSRFAMTKGLCEAHYQRARKPGADMDKPIRLRAAPGAGGRSVNGYGYVELRVEGKRIAEHRWVMQQVLGRPLRNDESVHHINGVRDDNRPENLELWARYQPAGQRVSDLVSWAEEILRRYKPGAK